MVKLLLLVVVLAFASCVKDIKISEPINLDPHHITKEQAIKNMYSAYGQLYGGTRFLTSGFTIQTLKSSHLKHRAVTRNSGDSPLPEDVLYIVNFDEGGFAVLAADDRIEPVICITESGSLSVDDFQLFDQTDTLTQLELNEFIGGVIVQYVQKPELWQWNEGDDIFIGEGGGGGEIIPPFVNYVAPLLTTKWGQCYPYNMFCPPVPSNGDWYDYKAAAGCIAISIAQIIAYHGKPAVNSVQWTPSGVVPLGNNPNPDYVVNSTWSDIKNHNFNSPQFTIINGKRYPGPDTTSQDTIMYPYIGRIVRSIGDDIDMNYGEQSWALYWNIDNYFRDMGYTSNFYWGFNWNINLVLTNLRAGRPVIVGANFSTGHSWVVDGYKYVTEKLNSDGTAVLGNFLMVHCNWGWRGDSDGYYLSDVFDSTDPNIEYDSETGNYQNFDYTWLFNIVTVIP